MSNILHLSKYSPFTLRHNLCNVGALRANYRKSLRNLHHAIYLSRQIFVVSALNKLLHLPDFFLFLFLVLDPPLITFSVIFTANITCKNA